MPINPGTWKAEVRGPYHSHVRVHTHSHPKDKWDDKGICCRSCWTEFDPQKPYERKRMASWKLSSDLHGCDIAQVCPHIHMRTHTHTQKINGTTCNIRLSNYFYLFVCASVCMTHVCGCPQRAKRRCWLPQSWNHGQLWAPQYEY